MADPEPLFIVDNSDKGRSGLDYLREWCELATRFDIATGYFDIGALRALGEDWQKIEGIRILMGDEVGVSTKKAVLDAVRLRAQQVLDASIDTEKRDDPFLDGVDAIVDAIAAGRIRARVYNKAKFHAKAYITHGRFDVLGSQALVGSSNFTRAGLTQNIELNIKIESSSEVAQLQRWYEEHWDAAEDISGDLLTTIEKHTAEREPFEVYAKALQALVSTYDVSDLEWDRTKSKVFGKLDRYQQEGYAAMVDIAHQHDGALLCDGVGLGKTFVGLMLIERLVLKEGKRVVLLAPKAVREAVWETELRNHLDHIGGFEESPDFSSLTVFNHTDLNRKGFVERFERVAELADALVIDEAHHFRNRGPNTDGLDLSEWSRYHRLLRLIEHGRAKRVYLLTATPINNSLNDFRHLVELFTKEDDAHFSRTLGVPSLAYRLNLLTKEVNQEIAAGHTVSDAPEVLQEKVAGDALFQGLVVQRSRKYAQQSQILQGGSETVFPERGKPAVAAYSLRRSHGGLLTLLDESFKKDEPLFSLAIYYPLAFWIGGEEVNAIEENRQKQVVGLIRTNFLKRFESSVFAFERSCDRLMRRLLAFLKSQEAGRRSYERWVAQHTDLLDVLPHRQLELLGEQATDEDDDSEDLVPQELLESFEELDPAKFDVPQICAECVFDLDQIAKLLEESRRIDAAADDKLTTLTELLHTEQAAGRKVLVFTEFADTARYVHKQLVKSGLARVEQLDGSRGVDRREIIQRFAPYYNGTTSGELEAAGREEIDILVTTDVLAEGLNLQDATRLVNYDIHWNPVRLMQRIGRVDRRLNPSVEQAIVADHPEQEDERGHVRIHNFLPPHELDDLLNLYSTVSFKTLLISKTLGIEGKQFLKPDDDYQALNEFNAAYEGTVSDTEKLHLELQQLFIDDPALEARLESLPAGVFSGHAAQAGVFFCYELPALDTQSDEFTLEAGTTRWYLRDASGTILEDSGSIAGAVRCTPGTNRTVTATKADLLNAKRAVDTHIKDGYLKSVDAPLHAPKPRLVAWMDLGAPA